MHIKTIILCAIILAMIIVYFLLYNRTLEHMTNDISQDNNVPNINTPDLNKISSEAIKNIASIYNTSKMVVQNLEVTGNFNLLPKGCIVAWTNTTPPIGWALCDGKNGTPDLRGRFIYGFGSGDPIMNTGGEKTHTLTIAEMPSHAHGLWSGADDDGYCSGKNTGGCGVQLSSTKTNDFGDKMNDITKGTLTKILSTGEGKPHNTMPPYIVLSYIMKL